MKNIQNSSKSLSTSKITSGTGKGFKNRYQIFILLEEFTVSQGHGVCYIQVTVFLNTGHMQLESMHKISQLTFM